MLTAVAICTCLAAVLVVVFGVVATSGVYGSRMAWMLGVALPLLVLTLLLAGLAERAGARTHGRPAPARPSDRALPARAVTAAALVLLGVPAALAGALLSADALTVVVHAVSLLS